MGQLAQVFTNVGNLTVTNSNVNAGLPMLNTLTSSLSTFLNTVNQTRRKKSLMNWFKGIPELTAMANKVVEDIIYRYHFEPANPNDSGRNKVLNANKFAHKVNLRKIMQSQALDAVVTGEGFGWKGLLEKDQVEESIKKVFKKNRFINPEIKDTVFKSLKYEIKQEFEDRFTGEIPDEVLVIPKEYREIASTSMEIVHDQYDISGYVQNVGGQTTSFDTKEIIHFKFYNYDGKPAGFSPVESIVVQLELLRQMWQNMLALYKNGGSPDKIYILENTKVNDPAYNRIKEQIQKYRLVENKHGNMIFTGKVTVEDIQQIDKMQFADMGLYITGLIAMQWQIPRSSIPFIMSGANTKDDTGGNSEKGYWRNIEQFQRCFSETMNQQLFVPFFGVKIVFDNTFLQQDVQQQTADSLLLNNVKLKDEILSKAGLKLNKNKRLKLLRMSIEETEELSEDEVAMQNGTFGQQLDDQQVNGTQEKRNVSNRKREEQLSTTVNNGTKPSGSMKNFDKSHEVEYKQVIGVDPMTVGFNQFIRLYNDDASFNDRPPRLFMRQNELTTTFIYKSTDFVYRSSVETENSDSMRIKMMNLGADIILL